MLAACRACHPKMVIFDHKKAHAASRQTREMVFFLKKRYWAKKSACGKPPAGGKWFWSSPTREPLVHPNKGAIGAPQEGNHWCTPRREPLVLQMVKNTKIFTKWSSIQHFEMSPIPKCTVFKTLHECDRVIAPKPFSSGWRLAAGAFFFCPK